MYDLKNIILKIVDSHSGGVKITQLLVDIITGRNEIDYFQPDFIDTVIETAEHIPELGVLHYSMNLGNEMTREKIFIYRK